MRDLTPKRPFEAPPPDLRNRSGLLPGNRRAPRALVLPAALMMIALFPGCAPEDRAARAIGDAIERHGGEVFRDMDVTFTFRGAWFRVVQDGGRFRYERHLVGPRGEEVVESLSNEGTHRIVDGSPVPLDEADRARVETAVNSVVYFGFLPFRLQDPAVVLRDLGEVMVHDRPYRKLEVTFRQDGGGDDWEDRFVYWFHRDDRTLDYLAYRYHRDGGGTRFRRAVNRREVGGLLLQDYENYAGIQEVEDIADYDRLMERGLLRLVSVVEMEDLVVNGVPEMAWDEGLEIRLGIDRAQYRPGDPMEVVIALRNPTNRPRQLSFATSQRYDLALIDLDGEEVYRWSGDRAFLQALGEISLEPGSEEVWRESLAAPDRAGSYTLQGTIPTLEGELGTRLPVEVRP
jgi:hypothetical protein